MNFSSFAFSGTLANEQVSTFTFISEIVLPAIGALLTLGLGLTAIWISTKSNRTSVKALELAKVARTSSDNLESTREKREIADLVLEWSTARWGQPQRKSSDEEAINSAKLSKAILRLSQQKEEGSAALARHLRSFELSNYDLDPYAYGYICGVMQVKIETLLLVWIQIPDNAELLKGIAGPAMSKLVDEAKSKTKKFRKDKTAGN